MEKRYGADDTQDDEVRMLDNRYADSFYSNCGERPILDEKFDILKHPNVGLTTDGNGKPYLHGTDGQHFPSAVAVSLTSETVYRRTHRRFTESEDYCNYYPMKIWKKNYPEICVNPRKIYRRLLLKMNLFYLCLSSWTESMQRKQEKKETTKINEEAANDSKNETCQGSLDALHMKAML